MPLMEWRLPYTVCWWLLICQTSEMSGRVLPSSQRTHSTV